MKKIFIRFGEIPEDGKSTRHCGDDIIGKEKGVSVYEAIIDRGKIKVILPSLTASACVSLSGCLKRKMYIVSGKFVGTGGDGEPLLKDCKILNPLT